MSRALLLVAMLEAQAEAATAQRKAHLAYADLTDHDGQVAMAAEFRRAAARAAEQADRYEAGALAAARLA